MSKQSFKDYLKTNSIKENILDEIVKTDHVRIELISNLIDKLTSEIKALSKVETYEDEELQINWLHQALNENEKRRSKLVRRRQNSTQDSVENDQELIIKVAELRNHILEDNLDLYFLEINKINSIDDLEIDKILLESRYNTLEINNRRRMITSVRYLNEKTELCLELLNLIDEIYVRENG